MKNDYLNLSKDRYRNGFFVLSVLMALFLFSFQSGFAQPNTPTGVTANPATICFGYTSTLSAAACTGGCTGAVLKWYTGGCGTEGGGTLAQTGISVSVSPTATTTYYVRWEGTEGNSLCAEVTVTVNPLPATPVISGNVDICGTNGVTSYSTPAVAGLNYNWQCNQQYGEVLFAGFTGDPPNRVHYASVKWTATTPNATTAWVQVTAQDASTSCSKQSARYYVDVHPIPSVYNFTYPVTEQVFVGLDDLETAYYCFEDDGVNLWLDNSEINITYQLFDFVNEEFITSINGTGSTISFENVKDLNAGAGTEYYVIAVNEYSCELEMEGHVTVYMMDEVDPGEIASTQITPVGECNEVIPEFTSTTDASGGYGTGVYYQWQLQIDGGGYDDIVGADQSTYTHTELTTAGTYDFRRMYWDDCAEVYSNVITIVVDANPTLDIDDQTNVSCNGGSDGEVTVVATGTPSFEYKLDAGGTYGPSPTFTGLSAGDYVVYVKDTYGCEATVDVTITEPDALDADVDAENVTCNGADDGTITISNPTGGYGTFEYSIDGGTSWQIGGSYIELSPGLYDVMIRDAAHTSCEILLVEDLEISEPPVLDAEVASGYVTCNGADDGTITITNPSGGYGTYEYSINNVDWYTSGSFTDLAPGFYNVQIRDAAHTDCVINLELLLEITEPDALDAELASENVTCNGADDGTITISNPLGGYGTYEYTIDGGVNWLPTGSFTALEPAIYDVRIRDAEQILCEITLDAALEITEPPVLDGDVDSEDVTCNGANDGTISILPSGGYGTYEYSIDGGSSWQNGGGYIELAPGLYDVMIRDAAHIACEILLVDNLEITEPAVLDAEVASENLTCNGADDGTITITDPSGGYGNYEYTIDGGSTWQTTGDYTALEPGFYNVQIRDADHAACVITLDGTLEITEPAVLDADVASESVTCNGADDGTITITNPSGGHAAYEYTINGSDVTPTWSTTTDYTDLIPGIYDVRIRDFDHPACVITLNGALEITEPAVLDADVASENVSCNGADDGTITITNPTGGYLTYEYSIDGGVIWQSSGNFTSLVPGFYEVMIRDFDHPACEITLDATLEITEPEVLVANTADDATIGVCNTYDLDGSATGGTDPYSYSWASDDIELINDDEIANPTFTPVSAGTYDFYLTVTDDNLCESVSTMVTITVVAAPDPLIDGPDALNWLVTAVYETALVEGNTYVWTTSSPSSFASEDLELPYMTESWGTTDYTLTVTETDGYGCDGVDTYEILVFTPEYWGCVVYDNEFSTPMNGVHIFDELGYKATSGFVVYPPPLDTEFHFGYYEYSTGSEPVNASPVIHSVGGVNATDALLVQLHVVGGVPPAYNPTAGGFLQNEYRVVADVNDNGLVNSTDALLIRMFTVGLIDYFEDLDDPDGWYVVTYPDGGCMLDGGLIKLLCYGDINKSYVPELNPNVGNDKQTGIIYTDGLLNVNKGEAFKLPVSVDRSALVGAFTINLEFNSELLDVKNVSSNFGEDLVYTIKGNSIKIAFSDYRGFTLTETEAVVELEVVAKSDITPVMQLFTYNASSEFADAEGNPTEMNLKMSALNTTSTLGSATLLGNRPNPFNASTEIEYVIPSTGNVTLTINNSLGTPVVTLVNEEQSAGTYKVVFNRGDLAPGVYTYTLLVNGESKTRKMVITE